MLEKLTAYVRACPNAPAILVHHADRSEAAVQITVMHNDSSSTSEESVSPRNCVVFWMVQSKTM